MAPLRKELLKKETRKMMTRKDIREMKQSGKHSAEWIRQCNEDVERHQKEIRNQCGENQTLADNILGTRRDDLGRDIDRP